MRADIWRGSGGIVAVAPLAFAAGCVTVPRNAVSIEAFEAVLAERNSATAALEEWCAARGFADPAIVTVQAAGGPALPATPRNRGVLEVSAEEPVFHRHVRLVCGGRVLSEAHNWYVPARLTAGMNEALQTTDTPFGKVIAPLGFRRERLFSTRGGIAGCPDDTVLYHNAVLRLPDGRPVSTVIECYTSENLR